MQKPEPLRKGSRIRLVAPASAPDATRLRLGVRALTELGFHVELGPLVRDVRRRGYLAGEDEARARAVTDAFRDTDVDGIVCTNGGYGSQRILPHLDFDVIRANPKPFVGFSDVTALHLALQKETGLVTFHGAMATPGKDHGITQAWTREAFWRALTNRAPIGRIDNPPGGEQVRAIREGRASGAFVGGNLTLVAASLGTPWEIDTTDRILFLEEWKEPPYAIDTRLMQLRLAGKLEAAAGIVFGEFLHCGPLESGPTLYVDEVLQDMTNDFDKPVLCGLALGHGHEIATLPLGVKATVDTASLSLSIDESAFSDRDRAFVDGRL